MPSYMLRDIPPTLWDDVRERRKIYGVTLRDLMLRLLQEFASGERDALKITGVPAPLPESLVPKAASTATASGRAPSE